MNLLVRNPISSTTREKVFLGYLGMFFLLGAFECSPVDNFDES